MKIGVKEENPTVLMVGAVGFFVLRRGFLYGILTKEVVENIVHNSRPWEISDECRKKK